MVNNINLENSKQQKLSYISNGGANLYSPVRKQINAIYKYEEKIFLIQDHVSHFSRDNSSVHLVPLCPVRFSIYPAQNCPSWNINSPTNSAPKFSNWLYGRETHDNYIHKNTHSIISYISPNLETTQISNHGRRDKYIVVCLYREIAQSGENESTTAKYKYQYTDQQDIPQSSRLSKAAMHKRNVQQDFTHTKFKNKIGKAK